MGMVCEETEVHTILYWKGYKLKLKKNNYVSIMFLDQWRSLALLYMQNGPLILFAARKTNIYTSKVTGW